MTFLTAGHFKLWNSPRIVASQGDMWQVFLDDTRCHYDDRHGDQSRSHKERCHVTACKQLPTGSGPTETRTLELVLGISVNLTRNDPTGSVLLPLRS